MNDQWLFSLRFLCLQDFVLRQILDRFVPYPSFFSPSGCFYFPSPSLVSLPCHVFFFFAFHSFFFDLFSLSTALSSPLPKRCMFILVSPLLHWTSLRAWDSSFSSIDDDVRHRLSALPPLSAVRGGLSSTSEDAILRRLRIVYLAALDHLTEIRKPSSFCVFLFVFRLELLRQNRRRSVLQTLISLEMISL